MARNRSALLFQYRLLTAAVFPLAAAHAAWLARRHRDWRYLRERAGFCQKTSPTSPLWIHAASVGEVNAALPLVAELRRRRPDMALLLTTATPTGGAIACARLPAGVEHAYLPFDRTGAVRRFLARRRPCGGLIVETELWPNLFAACAEKGVPLVLINGRVSSRTLKAPIWLRDLYAECLGDVRAVLARSDRDRDGFLALGAAPAQIRVLGNLKFAAAPAKTTPDPITFGRPFVLAASTREQEEKRVVEVWRRRDRGEHLLVLAPRHPKRLGSILADLATMNLRLAVRSRGEPVTGETQIYIADTFGELERLMAGAALVFVGGSLVNKGGQNLLEPARLGRPIVFGPHMENFAEEARLLLTESAAVQVENSADLTDAFDRLLADPQARELLGRNARGAVEARQDMAARYVEALAALDMLLGMS